MERGVCVDRWTACVHMQCVCVWGGGALGQERMRHRWRKMTDTQTSRQHVFDFETQQEGGR
mgnify:CR=1 FL=1